ncbi:MAG: hypothetical protein HN820_02715 [Candidatus Marinimicrobia bacterium]|nr:hypothetical protein [Candidatus Neomarinimicrobiota bacterium]MBT7377049.1 hypothetical protein [Candidatus Neomarinimicrobiota bacterium]
MTRIIILVLFTALSYTRTHHYKVEFMGVNVAAVTMAHRDTIFENRAATIVEFTATTESVSNYFFPVDNYYEIIHSIDSQQILSFSKKTIQPGLKNELFTIFENDETYYQNTKAKIPNGSITIFTLFHLLAYNLVNADNIIIEREGLQYGANLIEMQKNDGIEKYNLELVEQSSKNEIKILEHTDIFTWAVFKENANRLIWVNTKNQRIEKCKFSVGFFSLTAEYLFTDE